MKKLNDSANMNLSLPISLVIFLGIVTVVHFFYQGVIRPIAFTALELQGAEASTNLWVILKDAEQQVCISLGLFCLVLMAYKYYRITFKEEPLFTTDYLASLDKQETLDIPNVIEQLQNSKYSQNSSMQTWIDCLRRFKNTGNVQHAADAIRDSVESLGDQLESGNSLIRYFIWAIPSIGFIGTVRGIGAALGKADEAVAGDITGMVDMLGVAFNSTLVSLFVSIVLMYVLHMLNNRQDEMVINTRKNCEVHLLARLHH